MTANRERTLFDPQELLVPHRKITGMSAVLLPLVDKTDSETSDQPEVDWRSFEILLGRTFEADLLPAINMDTGFAHLIDQPTRQAVLERTKKVAKGRRFVAGAYVKDRPNDRLDVPAYISAIEGVVEHGGTPVIFPSFGLSGCDAGAVRKFYRELGQLGEPFIAFELGKCFAEFGRVYDLDLYRDIMLVEQCIGAKHSSLRRDLEWERLRLRNSLRPDFMVLTGNDLAIDMVKYGSDYLLGLSCFAPDLFSVRDRYWAAGDHRFYDVNDVLQFLGRLAFRAPVPAYKHSAAQFLHLRQWISCDRTFPGSLVRPDSDVQILRGILSEVERHLGHSPLHKA